MFLKKYFGCDDDKIFRRYHLGNAMWYVQFENRNGLFRVWAHF